VGGKEVRESNRRDGKEQNILTEGKHRETL
jgi:hypothetical protein